MPIQEDYSHDASDCILLVKHLVNSASLSQTPMVLLPTSFQKLLKKQVEALPRKLIADRAKKELLSNYYYFYGLQQTFFCFVYVAVDPPSIPSPSHFGDVIQRAACLRFLKTADLVEKDPWCLVNAAKALRDWVDAGLYFLFWSCFLEFWNCCCSVLQA